MKNAVKGSKIRRESLNFAVAPKTEQGVFGAARRRSFGLTITGSK